MNTTKVFNSSQSGKLQGSKARTLTTDCYNLLYETFHPTDAAMHKWDKNGNLIIDHKDD